jgi:hypothetical protein
VEFRFSGGLHLTNSAKDPTRTAITDPFRIQFLEELVNAFTTAFFCAFYYDQCNQGKDRPTALHFAQTQLRTSTVTHLEANMREKSRLLSIYGMIYRMDDEILS